MKQKTVVTLCALVSAFSLTACTKSMLPDLTSSQALSESSSATAEPVVSGEPTPSPDAEPTEEDSMDNDSLTAGTGPDNAPLLTMGEEVSGTASEDSGSWYAFTTGQEAGVEYTITIVNTSPDTNDIAGCLYDGEDRELERKRAGDDGVPVTITTDSLEADTTYYICLTPAYGNDTPDYTLVVNDPDSRAAQSGESAAASDLTGDAITPGTSQMDALLLPLGTKFQGQVKGHTYAWFAFSTGQEAGTTYNITIINATPGGNDVMGYLYDAEGEELDHVRAQENGVPQTISTDTLNPDTTYYICLTPAYGNQAMDYSVIVKNPDATSTAYKTVGSFSEAVGSTITEDGTVVVPGTNPNNAILLPMDLTVTGTLNGHGNSWFAFTTEDLENTVYEISFANTLPGSNDLMGHLYDEYGNELDTGRARNDGSAVILSTEQLKADTTYYISLNPAYGPTSVDYALNIHPSAKEEKPDLVFETPFEINETQIKFVINEAIFIDEAQAKEALKPVAEAILAHPDHSILIAGTTATDGTQETCVDLSIRRANAVKDLLINTYGVPESQLQIVGLGYELDPFERGADRDADGNFVESEGKKNRRVVILDIDDPIAQELLQIGR